MRYKKFSIITYYQINPIYLSFAKTLIIFIHYKIFIYIHLSIQIHLYQSITKKLFISVYQ